MASIKFDGTEILNTTYIPRFIKHESATERSLETLELAREDGSILISDKRNKKLITLQGILTAASQATLETSIDSFKELFSRQEKNLDIEWANGTRRYKATCTKHNFDRDHFHNLYVPWIAEFVVLSGFAEDTVETVIVNKETFSENYKTKQITLDGSGSQKIKFSVKINSPNNSIKGVELKNVDNGERIMIVPNSSLDGRTVEIDTRLKTVKIDNIATSYYGVFPNFKKGLNNIQISAGDIIDQQFVAPLSVGSGYGIYGSYKHAESFMIPYTNATYRSVWLLLSYVGNPLVACKVRIETDNDGEPSGILANDNATGNIAKTSMSSWNWYQILFAGEFVLSANTKYWIVVQPYNSGLTEENCYVCYMASGLNATYKLGNAASYDPYDDGGTWIQDADRNMQFKLCYGGRYDTSWTQEYSISQTKRYL